MSKAGARAVVTPSPRSQGGATEAARAVEAVGRAIHGYACGCQEPWPPNANVEQMAAAALNAAVQEIAAFLRDDDGTVGWDDTFGYYAAGFARDIERTFTASSSSEGSPE